MEWWDLSLLAKPSTCPCSYCWELRLVERPLCRLTSQTLPRVMDLCQQQQQQQPLLPLQLSAMCSMFTWAHPQLSLSLSIRSSSHSPLTWPHSLSLSTIKCPRQRWAFHYLSANSLATEQVLERVATWQLNANERAHASALTLTQYTYVTLESDL